MTDKQVEGIARDKVGRLLWRGMFNSGMLAATFFMWVLQGYSTGSYWLVGFGAWATYSCVADTIEFYKFRKGLTTQVDKGESNG